jgi:hypothetical protein
MSATRIYLSGPMTGLPDFNVPAFHEAAAALRGLGFDVVSPAEINADQSTTWHAALRADIKALCDCDAIALMSGWERSNGAHLELHLAHRLGLDVLHVPELLRADAAARMDRHINALRMCIGTEPWAATPAAHCPSFTDEWAREFTDSYMGTVLTDMFDHQVSFEDEPQITWIHTGTLLYCDATDTAQIEECCEAVMYLAWRDMLEQHPDFPLLVRLKS